mmetsp:Transcript_8301/g.8286  ORF Transcript_8301/g.8286 Transcript_8301/m.8286 type:complete len:83 (-) Transcript_8301:676-924(-)
MYGLFAAFITATGPSGSSLMGVSEGDPAMISEYGSPERRLRCVSSLEDCDKSDVAVASVRFPIDLQRAISYRAFSSWPTTTR